MKKILLASILIILIPTIIVLICIKDSNRNIKFNFITNSSVRVQRHATGIIESVPLEQYVLGVLSGEMPASFQLEALKAQAVAARSYVLKKMEQNKAKEFDVVDTVSNQVYISEEEMKQKNNKGFDEKIKQAVLETKGQYLTYQNQIIEAFFFSTSSGKTENVEEVFVSKLPYLRSVDSSWDQEVSPVFKESNQFHINEFYQKLGITYQDQLLLEIIKTTSTGRTKELKINGVLMKATDVASKLNLRSTFFEIKQDGETIIINTKGFGHGVGMSQYGAEAMAKKGYQYDQILKYYYQGVEISKI